MLGDDGVMGTPRPSRSVCGNAGRISRVTSWGLQPKGHGRERASLTLGQTSSFRSCLGCCHGLRVRVQRGWLFLTASSERRDLGEGDDQAMTIHNCLVLSLFLPH